MVAYAKYFSRFPLREPMFSQEFHDERFFYLLLYFFLPKLVKKLVGQLFISRCSRFAMFRNPFHCILRERITRHDGWLPKVDMSNWQAQRSCLSEKPL